MTDFVDSSTEKVDKEIVKSRSVVWLVWSLSDTGLISLRAICTKQIFAKRYYSYVKADDKIIRAWIEKTITNHLYGQSSFEKANYAKSIKFDDFSKL